MKVFHFDKKCKDYHELVHLYAETVWFFSDGFSSY